MFLDTSGLFCFQQSAEPHHDRAVELFNKATRRVTHNCVLAELVALSVARKVPLTPVLEFVRDIQEMAPVEVVFVERPLHDAALTRLEQRPDKEWSLCDAVSFLLMEEREIDEALTGDHDFEQAGFIRLLK